MIGVDFDDMEYCEGTEQQPHPGTWFYRPEQEQFTEDGFHMERVRLGNCPVCVVLQHVLPVMRVESPESDGFLGVSDDYGRLEIKR